MRTTRTCAVLILATVILAGSTQVFARANPSILMIYGGILRQPIFLIAGRSPAHSNLLDDQYRNIWAARSFRVVPEQLADRPYFNVAMFWGLPVDDEFLATLKPEQAHQQGRLYVSTRDIRAAAVSTDYMALSQSGPQVPLAKPIPRDISEFKYGAWLDETEVQWLEKIGVPLRNPASAK